MRARHFCLPHSPRQLLPMKHNLVTNPTLNEPICIHEIAIQLETCVIKDEIDTTSLDLHDEFDEFVEVVADDVLL